MENPYRSIISAAGEWGVSTAAGDWLLGGFACQDDAERIAYQMNLAHIEGGKAKCAEIRAMLGCNT